MDSMEEVQELWTTYLSLNPTIKDIEMIEFAIRQFSKTHEAEKAKFILRHCQIFYLTKLSLEHGTATLHTMIKERENVAESFPLKVLVKRFLDELSAERLKSEFPDQKSRKDLLAWITPFDDEGTIESFVNTRLNFSNV